MGLLLARGLSPWALIIAVVSMAATAGCGSRSHAPALPKAPAAGIGEAGRNVIRIGGLSSADIAAAAALTAYPPGRKTPNGWLFVRSPAPPSPHLLDRPISFDLFSGVGAAMVPVLFAYGGWQTANFIAGEVREPRKNLPRGLLTGVCGVIVLYLSVTLVCVRALGPAQLAATSTPVSQVMRMALGQRGAALIAFGIAVSTFGFLSQNILTAPRVYFAMAQDGLFFRSVAWVNPRTRVPIVAISLQGALAAVMALSGGYEQILNYVTSVDWIFFALGASCLFVLRHRDSHRPPSASIPAQDSGSFRVPGHPFTTIFFIASCAFVVCSTIFKYPLNSAIGLGILLAGVPVYFLWRKFQPASALSL